MEPIPQVDWQASRKSRRAFKKLTGVMIPPKHFPHIKSMGYAECLCENCHDRRVVDKLKAKTGDKSVAENAQGDTLK